MENNLLNAQNYILGKTEKKKLLSKFFVERFLKIFYKILNILYKYLYLIFIGLSLFFIFLAMTYYSYPLLFQVEWEYKILLIFNIFMVFFLFLFFLFKVKEELDYIYVDYFLMNRNKKFGLKDFLIKKTNKKILGPKDFLYFLSVFFLFITPLLGYMIFEINNIIFAIILSILILILSNFINFYSILMLPLFFVVILFIIIYFTIYVFLIKGIKSYKFLKYKPKTQFLKKFEKIEKDFALNQYYGVKLRK